MWPCAQGAGLSGSLFSRDEAVKMAGSGFGEDGDEDDEYEEEDAADKPLTGKVNFAFPLDIRDGSSMCWQCRPLVATETILIPTTLAVRTGAKRGD